MDSTVSQFTIGTNGELVALGTPIATGKNPSAIAIDPTGKYAYVTNFGASSLTPPAGPSTISQYNVSATDGSLSPMSAPTAVSGSGPNAIVFTPNGSYAYVVNVGDGTVSQYAVGSTGSLTALTPATIVTGTGTPSTTQTTGTRPFGLAVDPTGSYLYVANSGEGTISQFAIMPASSGSPGTLSLIAPAVVSVTAGSGVSSVTVDATGKFVYGTNRSSNTISQFAITTGTGALTPMTPTSVTSGTTTTSSPTSIATGY